MKLCLNSGLNEMREKAKEMNRGITFQAETRTSAKAQRLESGEFESVESKEANANAMP